MNINYLIEPRGRIYLCHLIRWRQSGEGLLFIWVCDILTTPGEVFILSPFWWWPPQWFLKCQSLPPTAVLLNLLRQSDSTIKFINPWNTFEIINHQLNNKYFLITKFKVHTVTYDQFFLHRSKKFHWGKSQHRETMFCNNNNDDNNKFNT